MTSVLRGLIRSPRSLLLVALFLGMCAPGWSMDLSDGALRLTLHEATGRFSLSCVPKGRNGVPVSLLSAQDPRTTMLSVVVGNKIYRMGESSAFSETVEKSARGGRFVWKSSFLQVTETFTFISSPDSSVTNGVQIDIGLKNVSEKSYNAGVRYLFDTWLGETGPTPFFTDTLSSITRETTLAGRTLPRWWVSPRPGDPEQLGLQCMVTEEGITQPDKIVFANWKRLSDAPWSYSTSEARDFSLLPYSKNDSAVAAYYGPRALPQGSQLTITIVLGKYNPAGFPATSIVAPGGFAETLQQSLAAGKSAQGPASGLHADLSSVDAILSRVDAALAPGASISENDLSLMESALGDLKARASTYSK